MSNNFHFEMSEDDNVTSQWLKDQFTLQRCIRWLDGANPVTRGGYRSFVQLIEYEFIYEKELQRSTMRKQIPKIWSIIQLGVGGGLRSQVSLKVNFHSMLEGNVGADIIIENSGIGKLIAPRTIIESVTFKMGENAPKKLNAIVRLMRKDLFKYLQQA
jgi:hypothetical protein